MTWRPVRNAVTRTSWAAQPDDAGSMRLRRSEAENPAASPGFSCPMGCALRGTAWWSWTMMPRHHAPEVDGLFHRIPRTSLVRCEGRSWHSPPHRTPRYGIEFVPTICHGHWSPAPPSHRSCMARRPGSGSAAPPTQIRVVAGRATRRSRRRPSPVDHVGRCALDARPSSRYRHRGAESSAPGPARGARPGARPGRRAPLTTQGEAGGRTDPVFDAGARRPAPTCGRRARGRGRHFRALWLPPRVWERSCRALRSGSEHVRLPVYHRDQVVAKEAKATITPERRPPARRLGPSPSPCSPPPPG